MDHSQIEAPLEQAPLEQAPLEQARLEQAQLEQAPLEQARLEQAHLEQVLAPEIAIIDAHHHLWIEPPFASLSPFPIEMFAAEITDSGHEVRGTVFIDAQRGYLVDGPVELRPIGETRTMQAEATAAAAGGARRGLVAGIVGRADMRLGTAVEPVLQAHLAASPDRFRGIRHMAPWHPGMDFYGLDITEAMMRSNAFVAGVKKLGELGLSFDAWVLFSQLADVTYLARAAPATTIILDHAGTPLGVGPYADQPTEVFARWKQGMTELAGCPNVVVKLGGLLMHNTGLVPPHGPGGLSSEQVATALRLYVLTAIDIFGPGRCLFESNFPIDRFHTSYRNLWNGFKRLAVGFTVAEQAALFGGTAARIYRLAL